MLNKNVTVRLKRTNFRRFPFVAEKNAKWFYKCHSSLSSVNCRYLLPYRKVKLEIKFDWYFILVVMTLKSSVRYHSAYLFIYNNNGNLNNQFGGDWMSQLFYLRSLDADYFLTLLRSSYFRYQDAANYWNCVILITCTLSATIDLKAFAAHCAYAYCLQIK
jgi:hypothetical protein